MRVHASVIGSVLLCVVACKKDAPGDGDGASQDPKAQREAQCKRFADDMGRTMAIAGMVMVNSLEDDPMGSEADQGRAEMKAEARKLRDDLYAKCLGWPEEVMRCLPPLGPLRPGCDERLAAAMDGATPAPTKIAAGPKPAWTLTLDEEPQTLAVAQDGTVLAVASYDEDAVLGLRDGAIAWRLAGDFERWILPVPAAEPTWVGARGAEIVAFDPATGQVRWTVEVGAEEEEPQPRGDTPEPDDGEADDEFDYDEFEEELDRTSRLPSAARDGDGVLLGDDQARFFRLDPKRCATEEQQGCITDEGRLPDEVLDADSRLLIDGKGRRLLWESGMVRAFDGQWQTTMTARAHDLLSHVVARADGVVMLVDDDVVDLDPVACASEADVAPSGWPQPGVLYFRDGDECPECRPAWPGCPRWRVFVESVVGEAPALLDDGTVVVHDDEHTLALRDGTVVWKAITGGGGPLASDGERIFAFGTGIREDDPPALLELSPEDGHPLWSTALEIEVGDVYFSDDVRISLGGAAVALAFEETVVAVPVPPPVR